MLISFLHAAFISAFETLLSFAFCLAMHSFII
jgi:hypothetical protein